MFQRFAQNSLQSVTQVRNVSSKYIRPHPRHCKRRWFEAAVAPVLPEEKKECISKKFLKEQAIAAKEEYMEIELALADKVKKWIIDEEFRLMAYCQFFPINERTRRFATNQLRLKGIEIKTYSNKVMKKVFENTPLQTINCLLHGSNCIIYSKDINQLGFLFNEAKKLSWLEPLAFSIDDRILSVKECEALAKLPSLDCVKGETAQIISTISNDLVNNVSHHSNSLANTLAEIGTEKENV